MPDLGNVWHIPDSPEPRGLAGMRDPVGAIVPGTVLRVVTGNQFQGTGGTPGDQLQDGSLLFFKTAAEPAWHQSPFLFSRTLDNNKYYSAALPTDTFQPGDDVQYYARIPYSDHDTTFVFAQAGASATTADEAVAQARPFTFTVESAGVRGRWGPAFPLPNVGIHASVLPTGKVLMWGRRDRPDDSLDVHECTPFVWNPADCTTVSTPQPQRADGTKVNMFCSSHSFLPDGRLLVAGGHQADNDGLSQACLYDAVANTWTPTTPMTTPAGEEVRRWYPTATTLPDGTVLVLSGSFIDPSRPPGLQVVVADLLQIWAEGTWRTIPKDDGTPLNFIGLPLYPRVHVAPSGQAFMSGTNARTLLLKTSAPGQWTEVAFRIMGNRDYCPAVMYDVGKVIYIGGGNDTDTHAPTAETEIIDLGANQPTWQKTGAMAFPRRQHNAVLLPDGTVLVLGGTRGGGGPNNGFNDLTPGQPVHIAELWNPGNGQWTSLTAESVDRCYHATAVLLPDARVLSAGGGEYRPDGVVTNDPEDSHRDAQIFSPPYLFQDGPRPVITSAPVSVTYGATFDVDTAQPDDIQKVSWIRLPSVTHSFNENQRINFLSFQRAPQKVQVTAPASADVCPPGHYMLFLLSQSGTPSVARIIQIQAPVQPAGFAAAERADVVTAGVPVELPTYLQVSSREAAIRTTAHGTKVVIGITGTCPYGIGSCWGGAYEALGRLEGVDMVSPVPDTEDSTAQLFLADDRLPPLQRWDEQFHRIVNGTYEMRGVEVTVRGSIYQDDGQYFLTGTGRRPPVRLAPLAEKIQWDHLARSLKPPQEQEVRAYDNLIAWHQEAGDAEPVTVTGPLTQTDGEYHLHVRLLEV
jgi:hypothetical protein